MKKLCKHPGCSSYALESGYCEAHKEDATARRRPPSHRYQWMYHTAEWRQFRKEFLAEHPLCERCDRPANTVDHEYDHEGNWALFWSNRFHAYCTACHSRKKKNPHPGGIKSLKRRPRR